MDKKKMLAAVGGAAAGFAATRMADLALVGGLLFTAAGAVGFAGYETMAGDHGVDLPGKEYLTVFAAPRHRSAAAEIAANSGLDMNATGALPRGAPEEAAGYALVGAQTRFAWLREGNRIFSVRPGEEVPRLGPVASIEAREGRWALISPSGAVLLVGGSVDVGGSGGAKFDKKMIFRDAR